ncbi:MAG: outer membrane receptor for ferrienterochelin and colicins [Phenylobacterium sp.]|jgi:outer membrane receptor for ferrienterochelin and colicins
MFKQMTMAGLVLGCCFQLSADDSQELHSIYSLSLEELAQLSLVTAASGFEQKVSRAPATVTVITSEEWQAKGARLLADVLATVPGFHIGKPQGVATHRKFTIRGLSGSSSTQIKLLIDGEPLEYMQSSGLFTGFGMPLTAFKRIEVIKGPGSAVYGADAFAGVINLVSYQHADDMPSQVGARIGSFNTADIFARDSFSLGESHIQWALDYSRSDDDKNRIVNTDLQTFFDDIFGTSASQAPGPIDEHYQILTFMAKWQWQNLNVDYFSWHNFDFGHGAGVAQALDPSGEGEVYANSLNAQYDFSDFVTGELTALLSYKKQMSDDYLRVFPRGAVLPIGPNGNVNFANHEGVTLFEDGFIGHLNPVGDSTTFRLTHLFHLSEPHLFRWSLGYEEQRLRIRQRKNTGPSVLDGSETVVTDALTDITGTPYTYLPNVDRHFYYLSLQDEWQITAKMQLSLGLRHDDYSDFGTTTNPRLGFIWQASDSVTLKLFAGSAFRAPAIGQLYTRSNPVTTGNPELGPETIDTLETGFNFEYLVTNNLTLSLSMFDYHAKDLIAYAPTEQIQGNLAQNIGEQKGRGGEFWLKWKPQSNMTVDFSYSLLSADDKAGVTIADIANKMAYLGVNWQINADWYWNIDGKWIADRARSEIDARAKLANYTWVTSKLERKNIIEGLSAALVAKNLFDQDAKEPSDGTIADDYPLPGRQLLFELVYVF